jgi:hypothetical protein
MNKLIGLIVAGAVILVAVITLVLYSGESQKNTILRTENLKTAEEAQKETARLKEDIKKEQEKNVEATKKLMDQMSQSSQEKDRAVGEAQDLKKRLLQEREASLDSNDDLEKLRKEIDKFKKENREEISKLDEVFKNKRQSYETRILSLEAQVAKLKTRFTSEAERYHYNLGVVYSKNKDYDQAVTEFKTALGFNPKNALAHFNLGIIFDDYFKDKENARYHYRSYLELDPLSDDADSVREWLKSLEKK